MLLSPASGKKLPFGKFWAGPLACEQKKKMPLEVRRCPFAMALACYKRFCTLNTIPLRCNPPVEFANLYDCGHRKD